YIIQESDHSGVSNGKVR
ncbi:unnamed protein product, partial [Allacma fusca]